MIARFLTVTYFALVFLGVGVSSLVDTPLLRGLFLAPAGVYVLWRLTLAATRGALNGTGEPPVRFGVLQSLVVLYAALYCGLYFLRSDALVVGASNASALMVHVLFWYVVYHDPTYRARRPLFFVDLLRSVFLGSLTGLLGALSHVGWSLQPGRVHNLSGKASFVRSDLDVPLLALMLGIWGVVLLFLRHRSRQGSIGTAGGKPPSRLLGFLLVGWCLLVLVLYSRRTPLFALVATSLFLFLPGKLGRKVVYGALLFPLLPLVWDMVVVVLLPLTQNALMDALLARNDAENYLTATNRLVVWSRAFEFLTTPNLQHLIGYGGTPEHLVLGTASWSHTHNAYLQLALEAGLLVLALAIGILVASLRRVTETLRLGYLTSQGYVLMGMLIGWIVVSSVEPALRGHSMVHMIILTLTLSAGNLGAEALRLAAPAAVQARRFAGRRRPATGPGNTALGTT
jgi:hypothetical protein